MEFSRPEYWSGQPFPSPEDLPDSGIKPRSPVLQADYLPAELPGKPCCCWLLSLFSHVRLCVTPLTAGHQAAPSLRFSRQEY